MAYRNTAKTYGSVTKTFHWLTALLILTAFPLGILAHDAPFETSDELAFKALLFSWHKTVGVTAFFVASLRILWALTQEKPGLLNAEHKLEAFAAETVHWVLYGCMVLVPLTGWIHHAAAEGFAPIWWPFGQSLPFIPKDAQLSEVFGAIQYRNRRIWRSRIDIWDSKSKIVTGEVGCHFLSLPQRGGLSR